MANGKHKKVIGIPYTLTCFLDSFAWEHFFKILGYEAKYSGQSTNTTVLNGFKYSINDQCMPIKLLYGHVIELCEAKVDMIFIPQIVSLEKATYSCPQIFGAPLAIKRMRRSRMPNVIFCEIDYGSPIVTIAKVATFAWILNKNPLHVCKAVCLFVSHLYFKKNKACSKAKEIEKNSIGVIAHPYVLQDAFLNNNLLARIKDHGLKPIVIDVSAGAGNPGKSCFQSRPLHWYVGKNLVTAAHDFMSSKNVVGIVYLSYFGCGIDAFVEEIFKNEISKIKPYLFLSLDEHTGEAGMITRLEAFIDMIKRKRCCNAV